MARTQAYLEKARARGWMILPAVPPPAPAVACDKSDQSDQRVALQADVLALAEARRWPVLMLDGCAVVEAAGWPAFVLSSDTTALTGLRALLVDAQRRDGPAPTAVIEVSA